MYVYEVIICSWYASNGHVEWYVSMHAHAHTHTHTLMAGWDVELFCFFLFQFMNSLEFVILIMWHWCLPTFVHCASVHDCLLLSLSLSLSPPLTPPPHHRILPPLPPPLQLPLRLVQQFMEHQQQHRYRMIQTTLSWRRQRKKSLWQLSRNSDRLPWDTKEDLQR